MREKLGKNARNLVIEKFNWEKLAKEFVEIVKPYVNTKLI
jgi:glycosyltransferase involved in cell wall biosynthesis